MYDNIFWYTSISFAFNPKYLFSASTLALDNSNDLLIFSSFKNLFIFCIQHSLLSATVIIKSNHFFSSGFMQKVLFIATIGSTVSLTLLVKGLDFCTRLGNPRLPLPKNFSLSISYSNSPIVSSSVYKLIAKYMSFSFWFLFFLLTKIVPVSSKNSNVKNKLLNATWA